ncbi:MAG: asparagine synthase (glutamine-hydrolyzing) [Spirochaetales bacterium]|nr:asparagine synthase (glutamine-hydrolyzing) [Spirochaetales bacterium]
MCGITGFLGYYRDREEQKKTLKNMMAQLDHRGPDGWGFYTDPLMALGHTRLSIQDLSGGHQPMSTGRYVISFNGEIFNFIELRAQMEKRGVEFQTTCDTEVVLKAFELDGPACFSSFNGQFALLIWDRKEQVLTAARDRYGIRPLYVLNHGGLYYFASELKCFDRIDGYRRSFNFKNLYEHGLLWNTLGERTVYENITSLPAGEYARYRVGEEPRRHTYYRLGENFAEPVGNYEQTKEEMVELLGDSVRLRLRSDVPVGNYLSGGIDSSVIAHLTKIHNKDRFKTFAVSFADKGYDESTYQKEMVERLNSEHIDLKIDYSRINESLADAAYHFERPVFRTAPVPLYLLSKKVREENIKVVLTGEAADEILCGYDVFKEIRMLQMWRENRDEAHVTELLGQLYPHLAHYKDKTRMGFMKMYYEDFLEDFDNDLVGLNMRANNNRILLNYLNKDRAVPYEKEELLANLRAELPADYDRWSLLQKNQYLEMKTLLPGYLLSSQGDRMSLGHSVEGRYPFLDHRLVEKAFAYPDDYKLRGFSQKHILRDAFRGVIPSSIIDRPKQPYQAPDLKSFFHEGRLTDEAARYLSDEAVDRAGVFDKKYVNRLIKKFSRPMPKQIGYRDNMLITFILSSQMISHAMENPELKTLDERLKRVEIIKN